MEPLLKHSGKDCQNPLFSRKSATEHARDSLEHHAKEHTSHGHGKIASQGEITQGPFVDGIP